MKNELLSRKIFTTNYKPDDLFGHVTLEPS